MKRCEFVFQFLLNYSVFLSSGKVDIISFDCNKLTHKFLIDLEMRHQLGLLKNKGCNNIFYLEHSNLGRGNLHNFFD
jgi:hypothetical protein